MNTLNYILKKYNLTYNESTQMPIETPNIGRDNLPHLLGELGLNVGAEIGVMGGEYSEILITGNPDMKLYCVDPWQAHPQYQEETRQEVFDMYYQEAKTRLAPYNCRLIRDFSLEAVRQFADRSLDFVYIDGNHTLQNVINDLVTWSKKVKPGGIISGHDYKLTKPSTRIHVYQAINAYTDAYEIRPWFVLGSYSKKPGMIRDRSRTWMWVKTEESV